MNNEGDRLVSQGSIIHRRYEKKPEKETWYKEYRRPQNGRRINIESFTGKCANTREKPIFMNSRSQCGVTLAEFITMEPTRYSVFFS